MKQNLSTPTVVAGNSPLPPDIFTESDPSGLKCSADKLHSVLFGRRHSTLQSHGPLALAKLLLYSHTSWEYLGQVGYPRHRVKVKVTGAERSYMHTKCTHWWVIHFQLEGSLVL